MNITFLHTLSDGREVEINADMLSPGSDIGMFDYSIDGNSSVVAIITTIDFLKCVEYNKIVIIF